MVRLIYTARDLQKDSIRRLRLRWYKLNGIRRASLLEVSLKTESRPLLPCPSMASRLPAIMTFDSTASDKGHISFERLACRHVFHVDVPVQAISFCLFMPRFPHTGFWWKKKTVITKCAITVKQYRES